MNRLTLLVGIPASGKSTRRKSLEMEGAVVICPDDIRREVFDTEFNADFEGLVWFIAKSMGKVLLAQGRDVVIDATNTSVSRRKMWIDLGKSYGATVWAEFLNTPFEECCDRNLKRSRIVPNDIMERMRDELVPPERDEGFDMIVTY